MPPEIRGFDFTPLISLDDPENSLEELSMEESESSRPALSCQTLYRSLSWTICNFTAIYATKQLMTTHAFHYPLTIAFRAFLSVLIVYIILNRLTTKSSHISSEKPRRWTLRQSDGVEFLFNKSWVMMIPASITAAVSLPMLIEGILHIPSLPVLIMLFPLVYAAETLVLFVCCSPSRSQKSLPWEAILATVASAIVLYNEYRLTVPGLIWGVTGVLFIGLSRALFIIGSERTGSGPAAEARLQAYDIFVTMTLSSGIIISGVLAYYLEHSRFTRSLPIGTIGLMLVNIAAFVGAAFSGTSVFAYSPISSQGLDPEFSIIPIRNADFVLSTGSNLLVILVAMRSSPIVISWIQIAAFQASAFCFVGSEQVFHNILTCMDTTQDQVREIFGMEYVEQRRPSRVLTGVALFCIIIFTSWSLSGHSAASIKSLPPGLPSTLDTFYGPGVRFEIVISMYDEDPIQVKEMLNTIKSTTFLSTIEPSITIYTKNSAHDLNSLKETTGANTVERLDNLGREGGTYLWHIVNKWDSLAGQTLFVQAHAHNMHEIIPRINSYLVPETGFLSLGFTGVTCDCGTCTDRWGWEDKWDVIPALYQNIYSFPCSSSTAILLTYKGQFVASARRTRGIRKEVYVDLLDTITGRDIWSHNTSVIGEGTGGVTGADSPDNPYFGFTMERIWGLVMQCATDQRIAAKCPSLLSGMGKGGSVGDCQCLDESV